MIELIQIAPLRAWRSDRRAEGQRIALVPTMGFLHEGHLRLVDAAQARADLVVLSIFVNPLQFGPTEDLDRYPRDLDRDRRMAESRGVALLFRPSVETMYPPGAETRIVPGSTASRWEGAMRPGHFTGVLTVVAKLFHLVDPDLACFGQKDFQQVTLIRQMVRDFDWPIEIHMVETMREPDGLALSSRNAYLNPDDRMVARELSLALDAAHRAWKGGEGRARNLEAVIRSRLGGKPQLQVDYIAVTDPTCLTPVEEANADSIIAIAARVGATRLIDNIRLGEGIG